MGSRVVRYESLYDLERATANSRKYMLDLAKKVESPSEFTLTSHHFDGWCKRVEELKTAREQHQQLRAQQERAQRAHKEAEDAAYKSINERIQAGDFE